MQTKSYALCAGPVYEYITNNNGSVVGNYSLVLTAADANTVQGKLPSSFDAQALLDDGTYTAVYTYYPTANFTQPSPLTITFQITVCPPELAQTSYTFSRHQASPNTLGQSLSIPYNQQ